MFSIYLLETNKTLTPNYTILDTEDIDVSTVFSISDISDISSRKDTITKNITFKGTKTNNKAFGNHFFLNKHVDRKLTSDGLDDSTDEKMFFNYIPSRKVDCMIFEDSILILNGSMLLTSANIDKSGNISYNTIVTGKIVTLKASLGDKLLVGNATTEDDLDFSDLKHQFTASTIQNSWGASSLDGSLSDETQRYDKESDTYVTKAFELGSGYVYPFIDYGEKFQDDGYNKDYSNIPIRNYRPAIYVKEYLNRILQGVGYSYEVKGDSDFVERFNRLIIPNSNESVTAQQNTGPSYYSIGDSDNITNSTNDKLYSQYYCLNVLPINKQNGTPIFTTYSPLKYGDSELNNCIIQFTKDVTTSVSIHVELANVDNVSPFAQYVTVELAKRDYTTDTSGTGIDTWDVIASQQQPVEISATNISLTFDIDMLSASFKFGDQVSVRIRNGAYIVLSTMNTGVTYSVSNIELKLPASDNENYTIGLGNEDEITPSVPTNIKQFDFVKSILTLLNLYVYNDKNTPTHLYLQSYNDFYSLCKAPYLRTNALNWTSKVDYSQGLIINSNLELPTKYSFSFKEDSDYLNNLYKTKYGAVYGSYVAEDKLGLTDTNEIQVIFSPTPMINIPGQNRYYGFMGDGGTSLLTKKTMKTNIRILFYNGGALSKNKINYSEDSFDDDTVPTVTSVFQTNVYGQASNYHFGISSDTSESLSTFIVRYDIHFSHPNEIYFPQFGLYSFLDDTISTSYSYYQNQIQEMIDPNLFTIDCSALLNEIDIGNLDFHNPIFIDTGEYGHSYFKLQSIEYSDNKTPSKVTLQKIVL